jgi:hypothetical protein
MRPTRRCKLVPFLVAIFLTACNSIMPETNIPITNVTVTIQAEGTVSTATETGGWKTYHSEQSGFRAEYPTDWIVSEQTSSDGSNVTTFSSIDGGAGIMVLVQSGEFGGTGSLDLPNTRCEEVTVGGITGTRCFDTLSFSTSTSVVSQGKTYIITSISKRLDAMIYNSFLASFQFSP